MPKQDFPKLNNIGHRLKELREKKGLSQAELAKLLGCAQTTVAEWERRKDRAPGKHFRERVAQELEVSLDYLLGLEKKQIPRIPCYGEVSSDGFRWPESDESYYDIEIAQSEYRPDLFSLKVLDDLLEPVLPKGDYGIFEKSLPKNGDIVAVSIPEDNKCRIKMWREQGQSVMLSEVNINKIGTPYFFEFCSHEREKLTYLRKDKKRIMIKGKLIAVKRNLKSVPCYQGVNYIF